MKNLCYFIICAFFFISCEKETADLGGCIKTLNVTEIQTTSAVCKGNLQISSERKYSFIENGICYSITQSPTINDYKITGERVIKKGSFITTLKNPKDGEFTAKLTGLQKNTKYFVRAYTINNFGIFYGNEISFTTLVSDTELP